MKDGVFLLKIATPDSTAESIVCDSVRLTVSDDLKGRNGGLYGIRKGHANALLSLDTGELSAYLNGKCVYNALSGAGFATVDASAVTVAVDSIKIC